MLAWMHRDILQPGEHNMWTACWMKERAREGTQNLLVPCCRVEPHGCLVVEVHLEVHLLEIALDLEAQLH